MRTLLLAFCTSVALLAAGEHIHAQSVTGYWEGSISIMGQHLMIQVELAKKDTAYTGTIDIPQQLALGLALQNIRYSHPNVRFELNAGLSVAAFDGVLAGDSVAGAFTQAGYKGSFSMHRAVRKKADDADTAAPPYRVEEVTFRNGDITLAGTLTIPPEAGRHPAVVMVTGSGPQNRDEELFGFKPFRIIADKLTRAGVAVLRYDDRGVGGSTTGPATATSEDFMRDALAGVEALRTRADIDTQRVGVLGHSEGGMIAPMAARQSRDVAFIVLLAGTSWPGDTIVCAQLERIMRVGGASEAQIARQLALQRLTFDAVTHDTGWATLRAMMAADLRASIDTMPADARKAMGDVDKLIAKRTDAAMAAATTAWFRYFALHDPFDDLAAVRVPVLALFGEKDMQVPADMNARRMKEAFKKGRVPDFTIRIIPNANHLFQSAKTGNIDEYAVLDKRFAPGVIDTIVSWVQEKTRIKR